MSVERDGIQMPADERQTESKTVQDFEEWEDIETGGRRIWNIREAWRVVWKVSN